MPILAFTDENDGYYQTEVPEGAPVPAWASGLTPTAVLPPADPLPLTKAQRIAAKLQFVGYTQEWMLDRDLAYALTFAQLGGVTEPQLYAGNATYHLAKDLKSELDAIRAEP